MSENQEPHHEPKEKEVLVSPSAQAIHDTILQEGINELERTSKALFFSGLAAGLSMSFSLIAEGLLSASLPDSEWKGLVSGFGYSVGFLIVILGKQQLFTENTLTPIIPLLHHKSWGTLLKVLRLWGWVLVANLLGALLIAIVIAKTHVFSLAVQTAFLEIGLKAMEPDFGTTIVSGIFAGWLIALLIWLIPYAETARVWVIIIITYVVSIGHFSHVIAGSVETFTLAAMGGAAWSEVLLGFILPALVGNVIGGVVLVAAINHAQTK